ncbi:MAG: hypothetical protein BWY95_00951 [Bacteroidetes bacterium ADurb.BinA104]|nr:MAG: hypothetical protein BWY95_00951 [Bacteroidetes bacterium ADurb.BinA104]
MKNIVHHPKEKINKKMNIYTIISIHSSTLVSQQLCTNIFIVSRPTNTVVHTATISPDHSVSKNIITATYIDES